MFFDTIRNAFKNIFFKKLRAMLTISAVAIGSAAIVIIGNISQYSSNLLEDALDSMGMGGFTIAVNSGSDNTSHLSTKDLQTVKDAGYIEEASPVLVYDSKVLLRNTEEETLLWGVDENADQIVSMEILYGRPLSQYDVKTGNMVCLIDEAIAKAEYGRGNIIGKEITVNCMGIQLTVEVVGIVGNRWGITSKFNR